MFQKLSDWAAVKASRNLADVGIGMIHTVRTEGSAEYQKRFADSLFRLITQVPRSKAGVQMMRAIWSQDLPDWDMRRMGAKITYCLLEVSRYYQELDCRGSQKLGEVGSDGMQLQAAIEGLLRDNGAPYWGAPFLDRMSFESRRHELLREHNLTELR